MDPNKKLNKTEIIAGFAASFAAMVIAVLFIVVGCYAGDFFFPGRCDDGTWCDFFVKAVMFGSVAVFGMGVSHLYPFILKKIDKEASVEDE